MLTDGDETKAPWVDDIFQSLVDYGVQVNTIAFGREASTKLEELSSATGGSSYFSDPDAPNSVLQV